MKTLAPLTALGFCAFILAPAHAAEQAAQPNLSGTYNCESITQRCLSSRITITQQGNKFEAKGENGELGSGDITSSITVSLGAPWNVPGILRDNGRTIEWSAGTLWRKQ